MSHTCHAHNCTVNVPPRMLMCLKHWKMIPKELQSRIWKTYRPGQEKDKMPSEDYLLVQRACVWAVFVFEGGCKWEDVPEVSSTHYMIGPRVITNKK